MDIVLEVLDTYLFDHAYAALLPAGPAGVVSSSPAAAAALGAAANATAASPLAAASPWQYKPASQYFSVEPSPAAWMSAWPRDDIRRQTVSLFAILWLFGVQVYFTFATFSYFFIFDHASFAHPKFLKNQIRMEMAQTNRALPIMSLFTLPIFLAEVRGYSFLYDTTEQGPGLWYNIVQIPFFILFTDFCIYWIHRALHHPVLYKRLHKPHHKWIVPTPFASHAFHPIDGFAQSFPYHMFPFLFPLQKFAYVFLFAFINVWTIMIHDGEYVAENPIVNGAACHTLHHLYFSVNYGQYTTLWDRLCGSYRPPPEVFFDKDAKMAPDTLRVQTKEMEQCVRRVEGADEREYAPVDAAAEPKKVR